MRGVFGAGRTAPAVLLVVVASLPGECVSCEGFKLRIKLGNLACEVVFLLGLLRS